MLMDGVERRCGMEAWDDEMIWWSGIMVWTGGMKWCYENVDRDGGMDWWY